MIVEQIDVPPGLRIPKRLTYLHRQPPYWRL